jgi:hypothetical protein
MLKHMPSARKLAHLNRRQRKKLRVGEFQELVFEVSIRFGHDLVVVLVPALGEHIRFVVLKRIVLVGLGNYQNFWQLTDAPLATDFWFEMDVEIVASAAPPPHFGFWLWTGVATYEGHRLAQRVFDLYKRHAGEVTTALDEMVRRHTTSIRERTMPGDALLRTVASSARQAISVRTSATPFATPSTGRSRLSRSTTSRLPRTSRRLSRSATRWFTGHSLPSFGTFAPL